MNCKEEFLKEIENKEVLCVYIQEGCFYNKEKAKWILPVNYSLEEFEQFLNSLSNCDYAYYLFGFIWYKDGTWSERREYDGGGWWEYKKCPTIFDEVFYGKGE